MAAILKSNGKTKGEGRRKGGGAPILNPSTSALKSVFDSSQLSGSINFQDGGTTSSLKTINGSRSKIRLLCRLALLSLFTDRNDRFPYPFVYFNK